MLLKSTAGVALLLVSILFRASAGLVINEVVSLNQTGLVDDRGSRPDWIELFNPGPAAEELTGWALSDNPGRPRKWSFHSGSLGPGEFLVVFASGDDRQPEVLTPGNPNDIPGLVLWLKADSLQNENPEQIRVDGSRWFVRRWPDLSGRNRHAQQTQPLKQPRLIAGEPVVVRFDGVDDVLQMATPPGTNDFTIFAVVRSRRAHEIDSETPTGIGGVEGQRYLFGASHGGDDGAGAGLSVGTNGVSIYEHGSFYMPAVVVHEGPLSGQPSLVVVGYQDRRPTLTVGGVTERSGSISGRDPILAPVEIGAGYYGAFDGDVLEIVAYSRALEPSEKDRIQMYLSTRHGLQVERNFHTNFRIDGEGEELLLTAPDGRNAGLLRIPTLRPDISFGRQPDGDMNLYFFEEPTPGRANTSPAATGLVSAPHLSHSAGFYAEPFDLELTSSEPGVEIRYTLNGSEPGPTSTLYTTPIRIIDRTGSPGVLSSIPTAGDWQPPSGQVFKGSVVRAKAFRAGSISSYIETATYFVHPRGRNRFTLPVVHLATDRRNFFDPDIGIYVPGNAPGGNYAQSGDAWERPVFVEFFETNGVRVLAQEAGVRMHGNTSFVFPIKGLRLHPQNQRGRSPFQYQIFPDLPIDTFHRLLLRPSGHDYAFTMMRDGLMPGLVRELGIDIQGYRPAILFINGEYWGIHNLQEAYEKNLFASHHPGVDADALDYLEGYPPNTFSYEGDATVYHDLIHFLETNPVEQAPVYAEVQSRMELANYRDYKLAEIFYYRWDIGNHRLWRPRTPEGRWRWILFDCDVGFGGFWSVSQPWSFDMLRAVLEPSESLYGHNTARTVFLLKTLLRNQAFREDFLMRAADLMNSTLSSERILNRIDQMAAEIAPEIQEHTRRWRYPGSLSEWESHVEELRIFARRRPGFLRQHLSNYFKLSGTAKLTLSVSEPRGGTIRCNSIGTLPLQGNTWEGTYFRGQTISIEAVAAPGWRFAGWSGLPGITNSIVQLPLDSDLTLTALYIQDGAPRITAIERITGIQIRVRIESSPNAQIAFEESLDLQQWSLSTKLTADAEGRLSTILEVRGDRRFLRASPAQN